MKGCSPRSSAESFCGASSRLGGLFFAILRWRGRVQGMEKTSRDTGDFVNCRQERGFIGLRRFVKTGDFPHELERSRSHLLVGDRRIEVEKGFNIPAHTVEPPVATSTSLQHFLTYCSPLTKL